MSGDRLVWRSAAVLAADIVAYSALMARDEAGTFERVKALIADLMTPLIEAHDGRVVKHTGDGLLAEFPGSVSAVRAAVAIQAALARLNADGAREARMELRIGVNVGEIIVDTDGDIHGDGVNVAVRLEEMCDPGGVFVSDGVFARARVDGELVFERLGERHARNIPGSIVVHRVARGPALAPRRPSRLVRAMRRVPLRWRWAAAGASAAAFAVAASVALVPSLRPAAPTFAASPAGPPLFAASVAILRFANDTGDRSLDHIADGLAEGLAGALSAVKGIQVAAPATSDDYPATAAGFRKASVELRVRYVVSGRLRRSADGRAVLRVVMTDVPSGLVVVDSSYDLRKGRLIELRRQVGASLEAFLGGRLTALSSTGQAAFRNRRVAVGDSSNEDAYDAYLRGVRAARRRTPGAYSDAVAQLRKAVRLDPRYDRARATLAGLYLDIGTQSWYRHPALAHLGIIDRTAAIVLASEELAGVTTDLAVARRERARLNALRREIEEAIEEAKRAVAFDPRDPENHLALAVVRLWNGETKLATRQIAMAMALNPRAPARYLTFRGMIRFADGDYVGAATDLETAHKMNPISWQKLVHLVAAYGHLGRKADAARAIADMNSLRARLGRPAYTIAMARRFSLYRDAVILGKLIDGLEAAGVR